MNKHNALVVVAGEEAKMVEVMVPRYRLLPIGRRALQLVSPSCPIPFNTSVAAEHNPSDFNSTLNSNLSIDRVTRFNPSVSDQLMGLQVVGTIKRTALEYNNLRELQAISNTRAAKNLKVSQKVSVAINHETVKCVCTTTGMTVELVIPKIEGYALSYTNPLATYKNVVGMIGQNTEYLLKLDAQVLAGMFLVAYKHYGLLVIQGDASPTALALNAMLRTAGKQILADALDLTKHIHSGNNHKLPRFSLDYNAHKEFTSVGPALQEYNKAIRAILYPSADSAYKKSSEAAELQSIEASKYQDDSSFVLKAPVKGRSKLTNDERDFEEKFIANRKEAKLILARLTEARTVPTMFIFKLKPVFVGKNLVAMADKTRAVVVAKLKSYNSPDAHRLAVIVAEGHNPYTKDDVSEALADMDEVSLRAPSLQTKRMSLADILAAKKAGTFVAESHAVAQAVVPPAVKLSYTAEDEIRHQEIEEALDAGNIVSVVDAKWNAEYLKVKEDQEACEDQEDDEDINEVDTSGEDF